MKTCGIYKITNKINGKLYIGQSVEIESRWTRHKRELNGFKHKNKHLERAWHKYGKENFTHEIIEICDREVLDEREKFWIAYFNSNDYKYGYNQDTGGRLGKKVNKDTALNMASNRVYKTGVDNPNSILNEEQVIDIKYSLIEGVEVQTIADKYGVENHVIYSIRKLDTYYRVAEEINEVITEMYYKDTRHTIYDSIFYNLENSHTSNEVKNRRPGLVPSRKAPMPKISKNKFPKEVELIKEFIFKTEKINITDIANMFGVKNNMVLDIFKLTTYKYVCEDLNDAIYKKYLEFSDERILSVKEVIEIKTVLAEYKNITNKELALKYNIDPSAISNIKLLKSYIDIAPEYNNKLKELYSDFKKRTKITEDMVIEIKKKLLEEKTYTNKELGEIFNIDSSQISRIKNMKIYAEWGSDYNDMIIEKFNEK